jgi:hypothetical protein
MFSVVGASAFLPFLPMRPIPVPTNNLLYDFSQTTIPTDGVEADWLTVSPLAGALGLVPLPPLYRLLLAIISVGYVVLAQLMKTWFYRRFGE